MKNYRQIIGFDTYCIRNAYVAYNHNNCAIAYLNPANHARHRSASSAWVLGESLITVTLAFKQIGHKSSLTVEDGGAAAADHLQETAAQCPKCSPTNKDDDDG